MGKEIIAPMVRALGTYAWTISSDQGLMKDLTFELWFKGEKEPNVHLGQERIAQNPGCESPWGRPVFTIS
jgi:hypothetical protein